MAPSRTPSLAGPLARLATRIDVPRDLDAVTTIGAEEPADLDPRALSAVWQAAVDLYRTGAHPSIVLVLRRHGRVVLNRAIGHARGNGPGDPPDAARVLATPDTPYCVFSAAKGTTATLVHLLVERGVLGLDDHVTDYLPDYARHGKGATTIRHLLTHRAGVPWLPPAATDLDRLDDRDFVREQMYDLRPVSEPGTQLAYHALSAGYVIGEIVYEATGKDLRANLAEHFLDPLGFRWSNYGVTPADVPKVAPAYATGFKLMPPASNLVRRTLSGSLPTAVEKANDARFLTAIVPSANVVTTGAELARFYDVLAHGGELDGVRVMHPDTLRVATTETAHLVPDHGLAFIPVRYGLGYMLGARLISLYGPNTQRAFGHLGLMNIIAWADPERALSGALITSGKSVVYPGIERLAVLMERISRRVPMVPPADQLW